MSGESAIARMLTKTNKLSLLGPFGRCCYAHILIISATQDVALSKTFIPPISSLHNPPSTLPAPIMASNIVELVNEYYEARKPYTQMMREAHASLPSKNSSKANAEANDRPPAQSEPQFSLSPKIPHDEIKNVLEKLEAAKIECLQGEKSTGKASAEKKGKAPVKGK